MKSRKTIRDRLEKIRELSGSLNVDYHIDKKLECLKLSLQNVDAIKLLVGFEGWQLLACQLENEIRVKRDANFKMSADPQKNEKEMLINYAVARTVERILKLVEGTLNEELYIEQERDQLSSQSQRD